MNIQEMRRFLLEDFPKRMSRAFSMRTFRKYQKHILAVLAALLIVVWLIGYTGSMRAGAKEQSNRSVGEILGKKVTYQAFHVQEQLFRIVDPTLRNAENQPGIAQEVWQTMVLARTAGQYGIQASDEDVRRYLDSTFKKDGKFSYEAYQHELRRYGLTEEEYENVIRDLIAARKYLSTLIQSVRVTGPEVREGFLQSLDEAQIQLVSIPATELKSEAFPGEDALTKFYDQKIAQGQYREPQKLVARYIMAPYADFESKAEVTEDQISIYYNQNKDTKFKEKDTYKPLDKVRTEITRELKLRSAKNLADEKLYKVDEEVTSQSNADWDKIAASQGFKVITTPPFSADAAADVIPGAREFVDMAFENWEKLKKASAKGKEAEKETVWMAESTQGPFLYDIVKEKPPAPISLQNIRGQVEADYIQQESASLAAKFAAELRRQMIAKGFDKAVSEMSVQKPWLAVKSAVVKRPTETEYGLIAMVPGLKGNQFLLAHEVFGLKPGEVSLPVRDGEDPGVLYIATVSSFKTCTLEQAFESRAAEGKETQVDYVTFKNTDYAEASKVNRTEAAGYFEEHKAEFAEPEKLKLQYLVVDFSKDIPAGEGKPLNTQARQAKARETMKQIREELAKGARRLTQVAEEMHLAAAELGPLSYRDLGETFQKRKWPESVLEAAKKLKPGELSQDIECPDSLLLLRLDEIRAARSPSLDEVLKDVCRRVADEKGTAGALKAAGAFRALAAKTSFADAVEKTKGLKTETARFVGSMAEEADLNPLAKECVPVKEGDMTKPVTSASANACYVAHVKKKVPYARKDLEEDIASFGKYYLGLQRRNMLSMWAKRILDESPLTLPEELAPQAESTSHRRHAPAPPTPIDLGD